MKESKVYREILEEGELKRQRADILRVLRLRFGPEAAEQFTTPLDALDRLQQLDPLLDLAVTCARVEDFRAGLPAEGAGRRRRRPG